MPSQPDIKVGDEVCIASVGQFCFGTVKTRYYVGAVDKFMLTVLCGVCPTAHWTQEQQEHVVQEKSAILMRRAENA